MNFEKVTDHEKDKKHNIENDNACCHFNEYAGMFRP